METQGRLGPELRECGTADWGNRADPSQTARMTLRMVPLTDEQTESAGLMESKGEVDDKA